MSVSQKHTSYHHPVDYARVKTRATILTSKLKDFKQYKQKNNNLKQKINELSDEIDELSYKRKRLMAQNFSAAPHLRKAHKRYWYELNDLKHERDMLLQQINRNKKYMEETKMSIRKLKDSLISYAN